VGQAKAPAGANSSTTSVVAARALLPRRRRVGHACEASVVRDPVLTDPALTGGASRGRPSERGTAHSGRGVMQPRPFLLPLFTVRPRRGLPRRSRRMRSRNVGLRGLSEVRPAVGWFLRDQSGARFSRMGLPYSHRPFLSAYSPEAVKGRRSRNVAPGVVRWHHAHGGKGCPPSSKSAGREGGNAVCNLLVCCPLFRCCP
jgi:hypothetical protein